MKFLSIFVCVRVGDVIPLIGGTKGTIVGEFDGKVLAKCDDSKSLVHVTGVKLED